MLSFILVEPRAERWKPDVEGSLTLAQSSQLFILNTKDNVFVQLRLSFEIRG